MNEQANIDTIRQVYHAFVNGDSQGLLSFMAQDIAWGVPEVPNLPFAGKLQGRDNVAEFFRMVAAHQQLRDFRPIEFIAQGDRVVVLGTTSGLSGRTARTGAATGCTSSPSAMARSPRSVNRPIRTARSRRISWGNPEPPAPSL